MVVLPGEHIIILRHSSPQSCNENISKSLLVSIQKILMKVFMLKQLLSL